MSVYNGEPYLRKAVDSILNQTFEDFEFLFINDASTDGTLEILKSYKDARMKIVNNEKNIGLTRSLNIGLKIAKGEYVARQDADDFSALDRLEKELNFLEINRDYAAVGSFIKVVGESGEELYAIEKPITNKEIRNYLNISNCIAHGSAMIRMNCLYERGFYDESIPKTQDYDLWLRLSEKYKLANLPEYLYFWRRHKGNISFKNYNEQIHYGEVAKIKAKRRKEKRDISDNLSVPDFSVLMANYNNAEYVGEAIRSVLNQTFKNWELIIVDDASTDDSVKKIQPFLKDKRIRLLKHKFNKGYIHVLNEMVYESRADIFGILDSDDILTKNALQNIYDAHLDNPDIGFIYSQFMYCDSNLNPIRLGYCKPIPTGDTNLRCNCVSAFRTFKKKDYFKTEGFDEDVLYAEDKDIIFKMEEVTRFLFLDKVLYMHRVLPDSQGHNPSTRPTGEISFILAKYKAYKRRLSLGFVNLTKRNMIKELIIAVFFCLKLRMFKKARFFLLSILEVLSGKRVVKKRM